MKENQRDRRADQIGDNVGEGPGSPEVHEMLRDLYPDAQHGQADEYPSAPNSRPAEPPQTR